MSYLTDEGIETLDLKAAESPAALTAYLDEVTGAGDARMLGDKEGMRENVLFHFPDFSRDALNSQDVDILLGILPSGSIMDRLVACLRILRIPASQLPDSHPHDYLLIAQRHLSRILVDHPVLMHNRIMVKGMHFAKTEYGPVATVLAETPRAEFPRVTHGVPLELLKAFANHWCVRVGLTSTAPKPRPTLDKMKYQGLTMLGATVSQNSLLPRTRLLASLLELDAVRALASARAPASLLSCSGQTEDNLRTAIANTVLFECGIRSPATTETCSGVSNDPTSLAFVRALRASPIPNQAWFLNHLETRLTRWAVLEQGEHIDALRKLAHVLTMCELPAPHLEPSAPVAGGARVAAWLIRALLDSSQERAIAIGQQFKSSPNVSGDVAIGFVELLEELDGESTIEDIHGRMRDAIGDQIGDAAQVWFAAMRLQLMQRAIDDSRQEAPTLGDMLPRQRRSMAL